MYYVGPAGDEDDLVVVLDPPGSVDQQLILPIVGASPLVKNTTPITTLQLNTDETHEQLVLISF